MNRGRGESVWRYVLRRSGLRLGCLLAAVLLLSALFALAPFDPIYIPLG